LLGKYEAKIVSVHDPDEYLAAAATDAELETRKSDVLGAYKALAELKAAGKVHSIGVGAKDISVIELIVDSGIALDWAMFACSLTPFVHSEYSRGLLRKLETLGTKVINSAVFNAGFLIGGDHFDYQKISRERHPDKFVWRDRFTALCSEYGLKPAAVCVQFSFLFPQVVSVALNTTKPSRVQSNVELAEAPIPASFWARLKDEGLTSVGPPVTIRHAVNWNVAAHATDEQKGAMLDALRQMPKRIPQIARLACGLDEGLAGGNHSIALTVDFGDAAAFQAYASHPAHLEVIQKHIKPTMVPDSRSAVQFALPKSSL